MIALPAYIDPEAWADYEAMRARIKKPMSTRRVRKMLARCQELKDAGHDVNTSLDEAADATWLDVYPPKDKSIPAKTSALETELAEVKRREREALEASRTPDAMEAKRKILDACRAGLKVVGR